MQTCVRRRGMSRHSLLCLLFFFFFFLFQPHPMSTRAKHSRLLTPFINYCSWRHFSLLLLKRFFGLTLHSINLTHTHTPPSLLFLQGVHPGCLSLILIPGCHPPLPLRWKEVCTCTLVRIPRREPIVCQLIIIPLLCRQPSGSWYLTVCSSIKIELSNRRQCLPLSPSLPLSPFSPTPARC